MSNTPDSDISSFAEWEAKHPAQSFSEREQSLLDMQDPARVWGDRDSSNDARSSDGQSASEDDGLSGQKGGVVDGGLKGRRLEIPSSTQGTESQLLSQYMEYDAPASSQPRPESSRSGDGEDQDEEDANDALLINDSILSTITNSPRTAHDLLQLKTSVQDFAAEHPFWTQATLDEEAALEFENDVFEFAQAAGLGINLAKVEVMRAMGTWKASKGIPIAQAGPIEQIFEKVLETIEVVTEAIGSGQKKRKREEKATVAPTPVLVNSIEADKEIQIKEPKAKRQRRREKKRKNVEETALAVDTQPPGSVLSDTVDQTKAEQAAPTSQRRGGKKNRQPEEVGLAAVEVTSPSPGTVTSAKNVKQDEEPHDPKNQILLEAERKKLDQKVPAVTAAVSKSELKSAKRIKNEKKKEKKRRAKQGPTTSSYFTKVEISPLPQVENDLPTEGKEKMSPQPQTENASAEELSEDKEAVAAEKSIENEGLGHSTVADKEEKRKRKKKRNKNRLPDIESADSLKIAEERAARKLGRSEKSKDVNSQITKPADANIQGVTEQSGKKKRVRSRIMRADQEVSKEVLQPHTETHLAPAEKIQDVDVVERVAIEATLPTEKTPKRKKTSETEVEVELEPATAEATASQGSEPPKKKSRDRKRKSINKLLDAQMTGLEEPTTQPLLELPNANSEKKQKRDKTRKRSSVGSEVDAQASKEASNSSHS
ncbi:hypothetical protein ONS96_012372 [Cadophora gregata f. sp. sojae]|nr:hypothetical protein ONS96_012372 [Cadophora gregata f. sp. sojae]